MAKRRVGGGKPPGQKKPSLTHFLCLPLVTPTSRPQLEASLKTFKDQVSPPTDEAKQAADVVYVHPQAIRPVGTLHCTLGVMSLDKDKIAEAISLLQGIDIPAMLRGATHEDQSSVGAADSTSSNLASTKISDTPFPAESAQGPVKVDLKGLVSMHSPKSTSVLYSAPSDENGRLFPFCTALQKVFKDKGFIIDDRPLKLHATIVNTVYAKSRKPARGGAFQSRFAKAVEGGSDGDVGSSSNGPKANAPLKIDATSILEKYADFVFAQDVVLDRVAICEMGAKKITDGEGNIEDEKYTEVANIALPT